MRCIVLRRIGCVFGKPGDAQLTTEPQESSRERAQRPAVGGGGEGLEQEVGGDAGSREGEEACFFPFERSTAAEQQRVGEQGF